ncbi:MAG: DUF2334 domain-containing protein [Chloroflexota bacterium]
MFEALQQLVGNLITAAVVPSWHGHSGTNKVTSVLVQLIKAYCADVFLHGFTHLSEQRYHPLSWLTERANEFSRLDCNTATDRLAQGQQWMDTWFGRPARGFVPPAWQFGPLTPDILQAHGFHHWMAYTRLVVAQTQYPLATWSWDAGRVAALGLVGEAVGNIQYRFEQQRLPCVVFHPNDVARGYFVRGLRLIERFLQRGYQPLLVRDVARTRRTI